MPTPDDRQFTLFQESPVSSPPPHRVTAASSGRRFRQGDASAIFLGMTPLEEHLREAGIEAALARDVSLLCPPKPSTITSKANRLYHKNQFIYDAEQDIYCCPAGQHLQRISHIQKSARSREHWVYAGDTRAACPQRTACTRSVRGRRIKRYPEDEARLALQSIMTHPGAQAVFRQRKAMVEPVFSVLRQQQGLSRFRRRGLAGVKREFALHALAYNLARAVALSFYCFLWTLWLRCQRLPCRT